MTDSEQAAARQEREKFEKWLETWGPTILRGKASDPEDYQNPITQWCWNAWQAALASQPQPASITFLPTDEFGLIALNIIVWAKENPLDETAVLHLRKVLLEKFGEPK